METQPGKGFWGDGNVTAADWRSLAKGTITFLGVVATFIGSWLYAINSWGWFLGISLGWIPAAILTVMVGFTLFYLWWIVVGFVVIMATQWAGEAIGLPGW